MKRSKVIWCQGPKIYAFHNDYLKKAHKCTLSQDKAPTCPNKPHAVKKQPREKVPVFHSFLNTPLGDWRGWPGDSLDDRKFLFPPLLDAVPFSASFPWSGSVDESKITAWWLHHRMQNTGVITLRHILNGHSKWTKYNFVVFLETCKSGMCTVQTQGLWFLHGCSVQAALVWSNFPAVLCHSSELLS